MWRTISYYWRVIYNLARCPLVFAFSGGQLRCDAIQKLSPFMHISIGRNGYLSLGKRCMVESGTYLRVSNSKLSIGDKVFINRNCTIVSNAGIEIGDYATIGPNVCIYDHDHDKNNWNSFVGESVIIGKKVWIGANVVILKGVTIGDNAIIGAGCVVYRDVPANSVCVSEKGMRIIER